MTTMMAPTGFYVLMFFGFAGVMVFEILLLFCIDQRCFDLVESTNVPVCVFLGKNKCMLPVGGMGGSIVGIIATIRRYYTLW